jgi:hypothetical protein
MSAAIRERFERHRPLQLVAQQRIVRPPKFGRDRIRVLANQDVIFDRVCLQAQAHTVALYRGPDGLTLAELISYCTSRLGVTKNQALRAVRRLRDCGAVRFALPKAGENRVG